MSKLDQIKIPVSLVDTDEESSELKYTLVRESDGKTKHSKEIRWVEFDEQGRGKTLHKDIAVGRSCLMSPLNVYFTWMTTLVTEIVSQTENEIKFKTQNSNYTLTWK